MAPAWHSSFVATEARAKELFGSGQVQWGLDEGEEVFRAYGVPYQPVTILIAGDRTVVDGWAGIRAEDEIRDSLDDLIALSG